MKIERLYKLNQFVEFIEKLSHKELNEINGKAPAMMTYSIKFFSIVKYKDRIKQSLTKEIVFNNESQDWVNEDGSINVNIQLRWMEAEKKVIFKEVKFHNIQPSTNPNHWTVNGIDIGIQSIDGSFCLLHRLKTLEDLANESNGQLKLKIFEI